MLIAPAVVASVVDDDGHVVVLVVAIVVLWLWLNKSSLWLDTTTGLNTTCEYGPLKVRCLLTKKTSQSRQATCWSTFS